MSETALHVESDSQRTSGVTLHLFPTPSNVSFGRPPYIALGEREQAGEAKLQESLWSYHWSCPFVRATGGGSTIIIEGWLETGGTLRGQFVISGPEFLVQSAQITSSEVGLSSTEGTFEADLYTTILKDVLSEVEQRLGTHNGIVIEVRKIAREEAKAHHVRILKINVRPAWSHEYDESHGVVIDVEMTGTPDERFSYWAAVSRRLEQLEDWLPSEGRDFLRENITFIVSRS